MTTYEEDMTWRDNVTSRLARIEAGLVPAEIIVRMQRSQEVMERELFGNGQPGTCQQHSNEIVAMAERVHNIERKQARTSGLAAGGAAAVSTFAAIVIKLLWK